VYRKYAVNGRKEKYALILLFTAEQNCNLCEKVLYSVNEISYSYYSEKIHTDPKLPVFFAYIIYDQNTHDIFRRVFFAIILKY